jgi:ubiquinone biosynthesis protein
VGGPAEFVQLLRRLGPVFIRFGRFLALRPDVIPVEYRDELLVHFEDDAHPLPWSVVRGLLERELGDVDSVFQSIDSVPVSFGALSQVHAAVTATGHNVLVRVLRPGIVELVRKDLRRLRRYARLMEWSGSRVFASPRDMLDEFGRRIAQEIDLSREPANIRRLAETAEKDPFLAVPRVYPELSTTRVLTIENLGGVALNEVLSPGRRPELSRDGFDFDPGELARHLLEGYMRRILEQNFYCTEVDPRNLLLLPGNRFTFVSFRHCESLDPTAALLHVRFLNGVFNTEMLRLFRTLEQLLVAEEGAGIEKMRDDFVTESHQWLRTAPPSDRSRGEHDHASPLANWLVSILQAARRNRFRTPAEMLSAWRTLVTVESLAHRLDPSVHLQSIGAEVLKDISLNHTFRALEPVAQRKALVEMLEALRHAPEYLDQIISELARGRIAMNLHATEHAHTGATRDRRSRMLVAAGAAVGVAWLMGEPGLPTIATIPAARILAVVLGMLYLSVAVLWKKLG